MKLLTTLTLNDASAIIDHTLKAGVERGMMPLAVAVLDAGGHVVALKRSDGSGIMRNEIAIAKAYAALGMGIDTRVLEQALADRPAFQSALAATSKGRFVALPGGIPVCQPGSDDIIGAVGVSGDTSENDEICAQEGIKTAGLERAVFTLPGSQETQ